MAEASDLQDFVDGADVDSAVFTLRPDYRVLLLAVDGLAPGASDASSEALLRRAEEAAVALLAGVAAEELPHIAAWREAYRAFGAKPQRTRNSLEALSRRAGTGLPRVNRLTDIYNAVSVLHQVPVGGEDLTRYNGSPRLLRAAGTEPFDTIVDGVTAIEHPDPGEVVWCDDAGVTCRRWNWRQARRTQLAPHTATALFILDALAPMTDEALTAARDELLAHLHPLGREVRSATRLISTSRAETPETSETSKAVENYWREAQRGHPGSSEDLCWGGSGQLKAIRLAWVYIGHHEHSVAIRSATLDTYRARSSHGTERMLMPGRS